MNPTLPQWLLQPHGNSAQMMHFERCGNKLFFCDIIFSAREKLHYRQYLDWGGLDLSNFSRDDRSMKFVFATFFRVLQLSESSETLRLPKYGTLPIS